MRISSIKVALCIFISSIFLIEHLQATVVLRDSTITWQHHRYSLNADYSLASITNLDNDIVSQQFNGKVIENELFRIVLVPEYGGRVLSYYYKPTAHEYLYQSACGTPYGINQGNFYYNWLMVYGGIFPTFPEPEHGKMWLKPWQFNIVKNNSDTVIVKMSITDNSEYFSCPGQFNNGITGIICDVEIGVYSGQAGFSFNVKLTNPASQTKKYEYWTCTTLTPGSEPGKTFSPVNSEIVAPMTKYEAAWSPNSWIGNYGNTFDFSKINMLNEWIDMGIGYATNRTDDYWGVINHMNDEGFFRIADRNVTKGMKLWTWGKDAVNANKLQISNGGKDDYIELWAGVGMHFFDDTSINAKANLVSSEYFYPTVALPGITAMNNFGGAYIDLVPDNETGQYNFKYSCFLTKQNAEYSMDLYLNEDITSPVYSEKFQADSRGNRIEKLIQQSKFVNGVNVLKASIKNRNDEVVLVAEKEFAVINTAVYNPNDDNDIVQIKCMSNNQLEFTVQNGQSADLKIYTLDGRLVCAGEFFDIMQVKLENSGIYVVRIHTNNQIITRKVVVK